MATITILAHFKNTGIPATGLSATVRIRNAASGALIITDAVMTEIGDGGYKYDFTSYDPTLDYSIRADGTSELPDADRYLFSGNDDPPQVAPKLPSASFIMGSAVATGKDDEIDAIKAKTDNLPVSPAAVGSAMTLTDDAIDAILDELLSGHTIAGSLGSEISVIRKFLKNRMKHENDTITLYDDNGITPLLTWQAKDKLGVAIDADNYDALVPAERTAAA